MKRQLLVLLWVVGVLAQHENYYRYEDPHQRNDGTTCYNQFGKPQRCVPHFINAAFDREVFVTNTCGEREPMKYCQQTGNQHIQSACGMCDRRTPGYEHPAHYLTDFNDGERKTWWQSETMAHGLQSPQTVNLTLHLGKTFDITYIRLSFISPRPESFVIYKKNQTENEWKPWAYFSNSCRTTYKLSDKAPILPGNEAVARCDSDFSDITPLTNGVVTFGTLEGRPSAENFEESEVLKEWVTASSIRITLNRMNTYGDEIYNDERVLSSYYYAISDFAVGGRCHCNGHANFCDRSTGNGSSILVCRCAHNTAGDDCQKCGPFHQDRPWRAATSTEANECLPCNCNGLSDRCFFDKVLYNSTGHGGHCFDCAGNTQGPNCEKCVPNSYRRPGEKTCTLCQCNEFSSESQECDEKGKCKCKPGVDGLTCSKCKNGFYGFGPNGCTKCECNMAGSLYSCSPEDGSCSCKANVEGTRCDLCRPGHFNLALDNKYGCSPCFCYTHSSNCTTAFGYYETKIQSNFDEGTEGWTAGSRIGPEEVQFDPLDKAIAVTQMTNYPVYYFLPDKYLGDLRFAYNRMFIFSMRLSLNSTMIGESDIKIVGENGRTLNLSIASCKDAVPGVSTQQLVFILHPDQGWQPRLRDIDFIGVLRNVTEFSIRGTYSRGDVGYLYNFTMNTASKSGDLPHKEANWVEQCSCGKEYTGQFCQFCAPGYRRVFSFGGPLTRCVPCKCNGHSDTCDPESGACDCKHNTAGDDCSKCDRGYYGNPIEDEDNVCHSCGCPDNGPCVVENGEIYCTECPEGSAGKKCEYCTDGYFKNEVTGSCQKCDCNGNNDANEIGSCDLTTGKCLKCINFTTGDHCEKCTAGFYGNATLEEKPSCKPCNCYSPGVIHPAFEHKYVSCDEATGQCPCLPNVVGLRCTACQPGYYNIRSGTGCNECLCDSVGSLNTTCDLITGQCQCKPGVTGQRCDMCETNHFGFSNEGCSPCNCDIGSESDECDVNTGQCLCFDNVEGRRCDQCAENWYDLSQGCLECDGCYELIGKRRDDIKSEMDELDEKLQLIHKNPAKINDQEFDAEMKKTHEDVKNLRSKVDSTSTPSFDKLKDFLNTTSIEKQNLEVLVEKIGKQVDQTEFVIESFNDEEAKINKESDDFKSELDRSHNLLNQVHASKKPTSTNTELQSIAREAQQTLDEVEQKYAEIEYLVQRFKEASKNASIEAHDAVYNRGSYAPRVAELEAKLNQLQKQFVDLSQLAQLYESESQAVYDQSIELVREAEDDTLTKLEYVNETLGIKFIDTIKTNFSNVRKSAAKQESKLAVKLSKLKKHENEYTQLVEQFKNTRHSNKKTQHKIDKAKKLKQQGEEAKQKAERVFKSAQNHLDAIKKLNENPELVRQTFNEKLEEAAELDRKLSQTEKQLGLLEIDVKKSQFNIEEAQVNANFAKQKANSCKQQTDLAKSTIEELRQFAKNQTNDLANMESDLNLIENYYQDHEKDINEDIQDSESKLKEAIQTNRKAKTLRDQINNSSVILEKALTDLKSFDPTSDEDLDELEKKISEQEAVLREADFETQIQENLTLYKQLEHNSLKSELLRLQMEKNQLQEILDSLPTKCFNEVHLETE